MADFQFAGEALFLGLVSQLGRSDAVSACSMR